MNYKNTIPDYFGEGASKPAKAPIAAEPTAVNMVGTP